MRKNRKGFCALFFQGIFHCEKIQGCAIMQYGESLTEYLTEIGLTESEVKKFNLSGGNKERQIDVLKKSRYRILDAVHAQEKSIQQIDYLIHEIKKN